MRWLLLTLGLTLIGAAAPVSGWPGTALALAGATLLLVAYFRVRRDVRQDGR
jgi:hypothetical protein